jgi:MscS family membrane protein
MEFGVIIIQWIINIHKVFENHFYLFLAIVFLTVLAVIAMVVLLKILAVWISQKTKNKIDDKIFEAITNPLLWIVVLLGINLSIFSLPIHMYFEKRLINIINSLIILFFTVILSRVSRILILQIGKKWTEKTLTKADDELLPLFVKISVIVVYIIGVLWILSLWGVEIAPFLASLGIVGITLGFALKDSLANIFGGISIILDRAFIVGDKVELETGEVGTIMEIGLRTTKFRTYENEIIIIPNAHLASSKIKNYVLPDPTIRVTIKFKLQYGTDIAKAKQIVLRAIKNVETCIDDPAPEVNLLDFSESGLDFFIIFWVGQYSEQWDAKLEAVGKIYKALRRSKMEFAYPKSEVFLRNNIKLK